MTTMIRVSPETRDLIGRIAERDYGGASADETVRRLAREHWQHQAIAAVENYRSDDPAAWRDYLAEAVELDEGLSAPPSDGEGE